MARALLNAVRMCITPRLHGALVSIVLVACWHDAPRPSREPDAEPPGDATIDVAPGDARVPIAEAGALADGVAPRADAGSGALCGVNGRDDCGPFLVCDPALGCVDCLADDDCPLAAKFCVAGACVECRTPPRAGADADAGPSGCPANTPSCWSSDHACHLPCLNSAGCPADAPRCDSTTGECAGCLDDADCPNGACSPTTRRCVECTSDATCAASLPRCDVRRGVCVQCSSNADCGRAEPICDPATRRCRVGCTADAQCPGQRCDPPTARCVDVPRDAGADGPDAADGHD